MKVCHRCKAHTHTHAAVCGWFELRWNSKAARLQERGVCACTGYLARERADLGVRGSSSVKYWETPKSAILARPSPPISTFCGGGRVFVLVFVLRESRRKLNIGRRERGASNAREKKRKPKSRDLFSTSAKKNGTQVLHVFFAGRVAGALRGFSFLGCIMNTRKTKPKDTRCASPIVPPWAPLHVSRGPTSTCSCCRLAKQPQERKRATRAQPPYFYIFTHTLRCVGGGSGKKEE